MATSDDLFRLQAHLPGLARAIFGAADAQFATGWVTAALDARYFAEGCGWIAKIRVALPGGQTGSIKLRGEISQTLNDLGEARAEGKDRWYGIQMRVSATGECETNIDYDPRCAEDESFFDV